MSTHSLATTSPTPSALHLGERLIYLVAEDTHAAADLALQLSYFGYALHTFNSSAELPDAVATQAPLAILIETTSAHELATHAAVIAALQASRAQPLPILMLSTQTNLAARLAAVRVGCQAYLTRPVDVNSLVDQLDTLTRSRDSEPYRVLIVDDSRQLARFYKAILDQAKMLTETVTDPLQVMQPLTEFHPDLILMDVYMPGCSGLELARVIRQQEAFLSIPIVFLSAETDLTRQLQAMSQGGDEFLTKPIEPGHLVTAVASRAERSRALRAFMVRDSLTGLLNHTASKQQLDRELARATRHGTSLALAVLDIDHFKLVNDTYGHPTGDQVLKSLARLLRQRLRSSDIVGRHGGEEFTVVLPDTDGLAALRVLDDIRSGFRLVRHRAGQTFFSVTFSCGIAVFPDYADDQTLLDAADKMLYAAKSAGRNKVLLTPVLSEHPLARAVHSAPPRVLPVPSSPTLRVRQPQHALIVEDDAETRRLLGVWLRARGYDVVLTESDAALRQMIAASTPDLLVLDVLTPTLDGLEILNDLRAAQLDIAVIVTTTPPTEHLGSDALRRGADDFLRKPLQTREFQHALERATAQLLLRRENALLRNQIEDLSRL